MPCFDLRRKMLSEKANHMVRNFAAQLRTVNVELATAQIQLAGKPVHQLCDGIAFEEYEMTAAG